MNFRTHAPGVLIALALSCLAAPMTSSAHSGGLDKNGCHSNRKTGDYHCHRGAPTAPRSIEPPRNNLAPGPAATARSPTVPKRAPQAQPPCAGANRATAHTWTATTMG
nr:YHYH domain-containing protein [Stenotrophomonas sp.]